MKKYCSKCKIEKDISEFHKRNDRKSGLQSQCKDCKKPKLPVKYKLVGGKYCPSCKIYKIRNEFWANTKRKDGLAIWCKICDKQYRLKVGGTACIETKICQTCKILKLSNQFHKNKNKKDGLSFVCKSCTSLKGKQRRNSIKILIKMYKDGAEKRGLIYNLTDEQFTNLVNDFCNYCGFKDIFKFNGIDRLNNDLGYIIENCVPCCRRCNLSKSNLTLEEWFNYIQRLIEFNGKTVIK